MKAYRRAKAWRPAALTTLLVMLPAPQVYPASTQLQVAARVLPTRQAAAAQSTVYIVSPTGRREPIQLSAQEKQALTAKPGYVPAGMRAGDLTPGVHVIEVNF